MARKWKDIEHKSGLVKTTSIEAPRYRLVRDDDAHWYLIPEGDEEQFRKWVDYTVAEEQEHYIGPDYDDCRINGSPSRVTFLDPKQN